MSIKNPNSDPVSCTEICWTYLHVLSTKCNTNITVSSSLQRWWSVCIYLSVGGHRGQHSLDEMKRKERKLRRGKKRERIPGNINGIPGPALWHNGICVYETWGSSVGGSSPKSRQVSTHVVAFYCQSEYILSGRPSCGVGTLKQSKSSRHERDQRCDAAARSLECHTPEQDKQGHTEAHVSQDTHACRAVKLFLYIFTVTSSPRLSAHIWLLFKYGKSHISVIWQRD